jgi:hypothetical protein
MKLSFEESKVYGQFTPWSYTAPLAAVCFGATAITLAPSDITIDANIWAFRGVMLLGGFYFLLIPRTFRFILDFEKRTYEATSTRFWNRQLANEHGSLPSDTRVEITKADSYWPNWDLLLILPDTTVHLGRTYTHEANSPEQLLHDAAAKINARLTDPPTR